MNAWGIFISLAQGIFCHLLVFKGSLIILADHRVILVYVQQEKNS